MPNEEIDPALARDAANSGVSSASIDLLLLLAKVLLRSDRHRARFLKLLDEQIAEVARQAREPDQDQVGRTRDGAREKTLRTFRALWLMGVRVGERAP